MLCNGLPVLPGGVPPPGVGRVALYNGTLELLHQPPDQGRLQEVGPPGSPVEILTATLPVRGALQGMIHPLQCIRRNLRRKINLCPFHPIPPFKVRKARSLFWSRVFFLYHTP